MFFTTIGAAFFVARDGRPDDLHELAQRAGVTDAQPLSQQERQALGLAEPGREVVYGTWNAFGACWATVDALERHDCLLIFASMNHYLDALPAPGEESNDAAEAPFVATFRDACEALRPDVALLDTRAHYGDDDWESKQGTRRWLLRQYPMVLERNVNALADERFSLLYLSDDLARGWEATPTRDDRDMVETSQGLLVFARSGSARMA